MARAYAIQIVNNPLNTGHNFCLYPVKQGFPQVRRLGSEAEMRRQAGAFSLDRIGRRIGYVYKVVPTNIYLNDEAQWAYDYLNKLQD